jgi:hypothetical protein
MNCEDSYDLTVSTPALGDWLDFEGREPNDTGQREERE